MIRKAGTVITLIFVFSVGQAVLALNVNGGGITNDATVAQDNQNRREGRRSRRWHRSRQRRHRMERNDRRHRRHDRRENRNRNR